jgi:hypothetical protein
MTMSAKTNNWGGLLTGLLLLLVGTKALSTGRLGHWFIPEYRTFGSTATLVGVLCLLLGMLTLIDWLRKQGKR